MREAPEHPGWQRGFWSLMATQFQNAFSDNALKNLVIMLVMARGLTEPERNAYVALAGALFAAPFILFSMLGGWLADRFSKQQVMSAVKAAEVGIMLFAALALALHNLPLELTAVFLMGCHSAIFGPSKYGILPEVLPHDRLSWGNGILELLTFLGIIFGTVAGAFFAESLAGVPGVAGLILAALAVGGWWCSRQVPAVPAAAPERPLPLNPVAELWKQLKVMKQDRDLWRANWGNVGFFFVAALVQMNLLLHAKDVLRLAETKTGLLSA
ncbi:MAG: MFS transporter, partial [Opitutales bacterium]